MKVATYVVTVTIIAGLAALAAGSARATLTRLPTGAPAVQAAACVSARPAPTCRIAESIMSAISLNSVIGVVFRLCHGADCRRWAAQEPEGGVAE